jgi:hypothetical protein
MIGRRSIILCIIGACILIGFVSQAQLSQKDESGSPLYEYKAAQAAERFGLAPSGFANSGLEFGSVATTGLTPQTKQPPPPPPPPIQTGTLPCPPPLSSFQCPLPPYTGYQCPPPSGHQCPPPSGHR